MSSDNFLDSGHLESERRITRLLEYYNQTPNDSFICHALGLEFAKQGDFSKSVEYFRAGLKSNPDYVASYYHLGKTFESAGKAPEAERTYRDGIEVASKAQDAHARSELEAALQLLLESSTNA